MLELKNNNAIISKTSQEISQEVGELIKIDIKNSVYSISNYMRQIQRLFDSNILRDWNEDIINIQKGERHMTVHLFAYSNYFVILSLPPMYILSGSGILTVPSALRLFSRNAISILGGATTVLLRV